MGAAARREATVVVGVEEAEWMSQEEVESVAFPCAWVPGVWGSHLQMGGAARREATAMAGVAAEERLSQEEVERAAFPCAWVPGVWGSHLLMGAAARKEGRVAHMAERVAVKAAAAAVKAAAAEQGRSRRRRGAAPARQAPRSHGTRRAPTRRRRAPADVDLDVTVVAVRRGRVGWWVKEGGRGRGGWPGYVSLSLALAGRHRGVPPE